MRTCFFLSPTQLSKGILWQGAAPCWTPPLPHHVYRRWAPAAAARAKAGLGVRLRPPQRCFHRFDPFEIWNAHLFFMKKTTKSSFMGWKSFKKVHTWTCRLNPPKTIRISCFWMFPMKPSIPQSETPIWNVDWDLFHEKTHIWSYMINLHSMDLQVEVETQNTLDTTDRSW